MNRYRSGFTLAEILVVTIIIAIIATFAFPNFQRSQEVGDERDGAANLSTIASAMNMFRIRNNGNYPPVNMATVNDINNTLTLGIVEQNMTYNCNSNGTTFTCFANSPDGWTLEITPADAGIVRCQAADCPTCLPGGCPFQ